MSRVITEGRLITGEELARTPGLGPCELIDGRIVAMAPTSPEHGRVEGNVFRILDAFVRPRGLGKVFVGEVGVYTRRNPDRVRAADALFVANETSARRSDRAAYLDVAPELVVEILSPRDTVMDLTDVREFAETDQLTGDDVLPGFSVPVATLFEE